MFKLAIICGGPSLERGISLNSARSFLDHTGPLGIDLIPLYVDQKLEYYRLTKSQLYSNTPSDFDFKLKQVAVPLSEPELIALLKEVDLVFPIIHGAYGEDGTLQAFLERHGIPFVGSSSAVCQEIFDKQKARERMRKKGFSTLPSLYSISNDTNRALLESISVKGSHSKAHTFWLKHRCDLRFKSRIGQARCSQFDGTRVPRINFRALLHL